MSEKKKIMVFIDWYLPGYKAGGPIRSVHNIVQTLRNHYDFMIVTSDTDYGSTRPYPEVPPDRWVNRNGVRVMYLSKHRMSFRYMKRLIEKEHFDYVYLNSLFSVYYTLIPIIIAKLWKKEVRIILAPRGMLGEGALKIKSSKKKWFLRLSKQFGLYKGIIWHASTINEAREIQAVFGKNITVKIVPNLAVSSDENLVIPSISKKPGDLRLIFLSRISRKKNLLYAIDYLGGLSEETYNQIVFDIYGPIEDQTYWKKCEAAINRLSHKCQVTYCGEKEYDETRELWSRYHFFLMPTVHENYGHAIVESLSHGRPVIISDQTPWHNLEAYKVGWDIPLNDREKFKEILEKCVAMNQEEWSEMVTSTRSFINEKISNREVIELNRQLFA